MAEAIENVKVVSEQYLQRLEKWRAERDAKKLERDGKKRRLAEIKGNSCKPGKSQPIPKPKSDIPSKKPSVTNTARTKTPLDEKSQKSSNQNKPASSTEPKNFKVVKSRLFDYLNKPSKPTTINRPSENTKSKTDTHFDAVKKPHTKTGTVKPRKHASPVHVVSVKAGLKRRHSEVSHVPAKKPASILKRKSCIPSIENISDIDQGTSDSNENADEHENDDVFISEGQPKKKIPVAMVTPGTARSVRFISPLEQTGDLGTKQKKTPQKPSKMREHLSDWLKAKGRTPSKFRHLMCFHNNLEEEQEPQTKASLSVEELSEQIDVIQLEEMEAKAQEKLSTMLEECMTLFEAGCPVKDIIPWLDDIYKNIPQAKTSAKFYECKASVIKSTLDMDTLLEIFETAFINNAQPREQIAKVMSESIKYVNNEQLRAAKRRPGTPRRSGIQEENMFQSSAIVYTVSDVAPFSDSKMRKKSGSESGSTCEVVTPVRRSTRRSLQNLPASLRDKNDMYRCLSEVDESKRDHMLFQPNMALDSLLAQVEDN